jgi:signal peptidase I
VSEAALVDASPHRRQRWRSVAFFVSLLFPGTGQAYAGALRRAVCWAAAALAWSLLYHGSPYLWSVWRGTVLPPAIVALILAGLIRPLASAIAAAWRARRGGERPPASRRWMIYLALAAVPSVPGLAVAAQWQSFIVPSESMVPTLLLGDRLLAVRGYYRVFRPERGDLCVFTLPRDASAGYFVKRLIGLPGERVQVQGGIVSIDGVPVKRAPIAGDRFTETLPNGVRHAIIVLHDDAPMENTSVFTVPPDHYFMMGDNRDDSADSRDPAMGFVPAANLVASAAFLTYSTEAAVPWWRFSAWRWRRVARALD